jgi:4'-phosphopantetheinyl transferase
MNVDLYILHTSLVKENLSVVLSFIDKGRKDKAEKYLNEKDRLLSYGAGLLIKKYLPSGEIKETKNKKPYLENGPYFNISHSSEFAVLAICESCEIGVDIEQVNEKKVDAIKFTLCEDEKKINDVNNLFRMWSNKESLIKCMSSNLNDIRKLNGLPLEGYRSINGEDCYTKSMIYEGYSLSVTLHSKEDFEIVINRIDSLEELN